MHAPQFFFAKFRKKYAWNIRVYTVVGPLIYHLLPNVWKASYTVSASIIVDVSFDHPVARISLISCVVPGPSQLFIHFGEEIAIAWTHIGCVRCVFQNPPLPAAQEVHDSRSSVTLCIVMKNDVVVYHQVSSFSPESMRLWSLRQSERITARDAVQHKRLTFPCYKGE